MSQYFLVETTEDHVKVVNIGSETKDVNTLSEPVVRELNDLVDELARDSQTKGVVFISAKKDFVVGADINEFAKFETVEESAEAARALQGVFSKIAKLPFPTVAAINGQCLGGGLEFALACTWRMVTDSPKTKLGLPEIQLGLIPGAGGTQRLPRLVGIQASLDLILTGKRLTGQRAMKMGLADVVVPEGLLRSEAVKLATKKKTDTRKSSSFSATISKDLPRWATESNPLGRKLIEKKAREMVEKNTKGFYPAAYKALEAVFEGYERTLEKGLELEAKLFGQLAQTRESHSLVHLFHATTKIKKNPYAEEGKEHFGSKKTELVGVIGAGFMGAGIATVTADKGIRVRMSDPSKDATGRALKNAHDYFEKQVQKKRLKPFQAAQKFAHISPGLSPQGFGRCDVVIEAVFEDLGLKQKLLKQIEDMGNKDLIFASNTSAIPIGEIAAVASAPERVLGMHFFSPVEKMPLLEVIVTDKTAPWAAARAVELGQTMGKQVIVVKDGPGFYTTRALAFFLAEAASILAEGGRIDTIDRALTDFGFPVGPITLIDEVGIDVGQHVLETIHKAFPDRMIMPPGVQEVLESGRLGRKNSKGFYRYENGKKAGVDESVYSLVPRQSEPKNLPADEIVDRCMLLFVNESVRCLEEGILSSAYDGDVGAVFGLGFPPFWGGPFKYVDHMGAQIVVDRLNGLSDKYGKRFEPADLLKEYASGDKRFFPEER